MPDKKCLFKLIIHAPGGAESEYEVPIGITTIGREPDNLLQLDDRTISRYHARLECIASECSITDLGSSNGTFINQNKIPPSVSITLNNLDQIKFGTKFEVVFLQTDVVEETPIQEPVEIPAIEPTSGKAEPPLPPEPLFPPSIGGEEKDLSEFLINHPLLQYLPEIYHTDFMKRFLNIFEATLVPIIWTIDNFDLYLSPRTSPTAFLPWLSNLYEVEFDSSWEEARQRQFLEEAWSLYARRGTKGCLTRVLEIYTGQTPKIDDSTKELRPYMFRVTLPISEESTSRASIENLINYYKPAHTDYELQFQG